MSEYFQAAKPESASPCTLADACSPLVPLAGSPIDVYYARVEKLVVRAQIAQQASEDELIPLLFLRLISATESYVRSLLSQLPAICPLMWRHCSSEMVPLGAGFHYGRAAITVAMLEHVSLCTKGEICKQTLKVTDFHTSSDGSLRAAIEGFEAISQLRHSVVHSYDELFYKNVKELGLLDNSDSRYAVSISPLLFQRFVSVCHSFVRAYNRTLLDYTLSSWVRGGELALDWTVDKRKFEPVFKCFYSTRDGGGALNAYRAFLLTKKKAAVLLATP